MFTFGVGPREYRYYAVGLYTPEIHCPNDTAKMAELHKKNSL